MNKKAFKGTYSNHVLTVAGLESRLRDMRNKSDKKEVWLRHGKRRSPLPSTYYMWDDFETHLGQPTSNILLYFPKE